MRLAIGTFSFTAIVVAIAIAVAAPGSGGGAKAPSKASASSPAAHVATTQQNGGAARDVSLESKKAVPPRTITVLVKSDEEHAKKGPEGTWHDAFLPASFSVKAGQKVTVVVYNYDEGKHSFTSPMLGLNVVLDEGSAKSPHRTTFTFTAPAKAGQYEWFCDFPCDPWAMTHKGYMRGDVTVS